MSYILLVLYYYYDSFEGFLLFSNVILGNKMIHSGYSFNIKAINGYTRLFDEILIEKSKERTVSIFGRSININKVRRKVNEKITEKIDRFQESMDKSYAKIEDDDQDDDDDEDRQQDEKSNLVEYFEKMGLSTKSFTVDWFFTLYSRAFGLEMVRVIWDLFFLLGDNFLIEVGVSMMMLMEDDLRNNYMDQGFNYVRVKTEQMKISKVLEKTFENEMSEEKIDFLYQKLYEEINPDPNFPDILHDC